MCAHLPGIHSNGLGKAAQQVVEGKAVQRARPQLLVQLHDADCLKHLVGGRLVLQIVLRVPARMQATSALILLLILVLAFWRPVGSHLEFTCPVAVCVCQRSYHALLTRLHFVIIWRS